VRTFSGIIDDPLISSFQAISFLDKLRRYSRSIGAENDNFLLDKFQRRITHARLMKADRAIQPTLTTFFTPRAQNKSDNASEDDDDIAEEDEIMMT
jgi:hypothetical protein